MALSVRPEEGSAKRTRAIIACGSLAARFEVIERRMNRDIDASSVARSIAARPEFPGHRDRLTLQMYRNGTHK
jgi:hypothetical protein